MGARYWRECLVGGLLLLAAATVGISRMQVNACRAKVAEYEAAYNALARSVQVQNEAVQGLEKKAAAAASRAAQARSEAAGAVKVAQIRADALAARLVAPAGASECPAKDAVLIVRADLAP
ncbi:MAG: hypothetical protein VW362_01610 [Candidatus Nanopelagicales bacterium]